MKLADDVPHKAMSSYTPIFSKIVDSSLWDEPDHVVKIFISMLAKKDRDNVVRANAFNIARWSRKTEADVLDALKVLAAPDTKRLEPQQYDGRRIEKVEDGWLILQGEYYQKLMMEVNMRAYKREKQREYRAAESSTPTSRTPALHFQKPTLADLQLEGLSEHESRKFLAHYESNGWKVGKNPMKSWKGAAAGWKTRSAEYTNGTNGSVSVQSSMPDLSKMTKKQQQDYIFDNCQ